MNEEAKNLAKNVRKLMSFNNDTQVTLAKKSGISQKTISNIINADDDKSPNLKNVAAIAKAYKIQVWHLLYPNAPLDILKNDTVEKLVGNYVITTAQGRNAIMSVCEATSSYSAMATA